MTTKIKCPHCHKTFEPTEAYKHELEEKVVQQINAKHSEEIKKLKLEKQKSEETIKQAMVKATKEAEQQALTKLNKSFEKRLNDLKKEKEEEEQRSSKLLKELEKLTDELRELRRKDEERSLEMKKKLAKEESKIIEQTKKKTLEEHSLKDKEKDKKLSDALKQIEQLKTKIQQGSQQTQGEVLELELEEELKKEFPNDEIKEIKKGQRGADVIQTVIDKKGRSCGTILWESKNAKWQNGWIQKLKEDQREAKAHLGVLVATNKPKEIGLFKYHQGIWITSRKAMINLASALRFDLIHINHEKLLNVDKSEKMEVLYQYLTGTEFKHRVESIAEAFTNLQEDIEREKRWFNTKWARQEKELRKIVDSTHGMYGELQAVSGRALEPIKQLESPED